MFENLLFIYGESKIKTDESGNKYSDGIFDSVFWGRYYKIARNISICFRQEEQIYSEKYASSKWVKIDQSKMEIYELPNIMQSVKNYLSIFKRKEISNILMNAIIECDAAIIRLPSNTGIKVVRYCERKKKPYMIEIVGDPIASMRFHSIYGRILAPIAGFKLRRIVKKAPLVLYVSNRLLQNMYPTKGKSVGCPDVNLTPPRIEVLYHRLDKINQSNSAYSLGLIGSLDVGYRGHDVAIKALAYLRSQGYDCSFRFLGAGNAERWKALASRYGVEKYVEFSGVLPAGEKVFEWIDSIDMLVMPSKVESLGRAIIEAMSRGCPVIGALGTAHEEQLGIDCLADATDYIAISEKIIHLINDKRYVSYCAYENYYRSMKYTNEQIDPIRDEFFKLFANDFAYKN